MHLLGGRQEHVAMALQPHLAEVVQPLVLEELGKLGVAQARLAELNLEVRLEEALEAGERDALLALRQVAEQLTDVFAQAIPSGDSARLPLMASARLQALRTPFLDHRLGMPVGHYGTIRVAQQLLLRYRELHDVAHLPQRSAGKERQATPDQDPGAQVPPSWQDHICFAQVAKVLLCSTPKLGWVWVHRTVHIDETRRPVAEAD
mmetsp:Transcript_96115/g.255377  ORF Transcript_96115/g.255377 Transcript_96115/m.255377 type:complete len:205 (+) Transcript_96115:784-1398(+)